MYKTLIWCAAAISGLTACGVIVAVASAQQKPLAVAAMQPEITQAVVTPTEVPVQPEAKSEKKEDAKVGQLTDYLLEAMRSAVKPMSVSASYEDIAHDVATVVLDPTEPPMWKDDSTKARTAIMLVSIAYHETSFLAYTDDGRCNDRKWRDSAEGRKTMAQSGSCDGGLARSMWQVHTDFGGIYVIPANYDDDTREINKREWTYANQDVDDGTLIRSEQMKDRQSACRVALHMARRSIRNHAKLCQFTGEMGECPKGDIRYDWAERYSTKHPFHFAPEEVASTP